MVRVNSNRILTFTRNFINISTGTVSFSRPNMCVVRQTNMETKRICLLFLQSDARQISLS